MLDFVTSNSVDVSGIEYIGYVVQQIAHSYSKTRPNALTVWWKMGQQPLKVAMDLYDLLAGVSITGCQQGLDQERDVGSWARMKEKGLVGGGVYLDFRSWLILVWWLDQTCQTKMGHLLPTT